MKFYLSVFGVFLSVLIVNSRNVDEKIETDDLSGLSEDPQLFPRSRHSGGNHLRHRRKRWQNDYGYDYPRPNPLYSERRYDHNYQDLYPQILILLEELLSYLKRPPSSPPQPIYIPYPVPQAPCVCPRNSQNNTNQPPSIFSRWPILEDTNQNWGFVETEEPDTGGDGSRPVSFEPITPITKRLRSQASAQNGNDFTTRNPLELSLPTQCDTAVISCCLGSKSSGQQRTCFIKFGCDASYTKGVCEKKNVLRVFEVYKKAYSLVD